MRRWNTAFHVSLQSEFARERLAEIVPGLLASFRRFCEPDEAVIAFDRFLAGLHGGGRLFSLLRQNPDLIALLALVLGTAPRLADSLAQFPEIMDAVIDPSFFGALPEKSELAAVLERSLGQAGSYEEFLDRIRIFAQEQTFLIGMRILSGTASANQAGEVLPGLPMCSSVRSIAHRGQVRAAARPHRGPGDRDPRLGKLGGREMTATSDLDLIVVYDFDSEHPESGGRRPLYGAQYFSRLIQRLISALTAQTNHGCSIRWICGAAVGPLRAARDPDRRLCELPGEPRPGPGNTWRSRGRVSFRLRRSSPRASSVIRAVLCRPRDSESVAGDVVEMRRAIAAEKGDSDRWNSNTSPAG